MLDLALLINRPELPLESLQGIVTDGLVTGMSRELQLDAAAVVLTELADDDTVSVEMLYKALQMYRALVSCINHTYDNLN